MYCHKDRTHHRLLRLPRRPRVKFAFPGLSWIWGGGLGKSNLFMRGLELWRYSVRLQAISSCAAEERDGWMGGKRSSGGKDT